MSGGIVGGEPAAPGAWPDVAAIFYGEIYGCTGTLVAPDVVLTAGHCGTGATRVILGASDWAVDGEPFGVAEILVHPDPLGTLDVGLLRLDRPAGVPPRALARACSAPETGDEVLILGFGATDAWGTEEGTALRQAATVIADADCTDAAAGCRGVGELVAGGDGVDSCVGDSGGPLLLAGLVAGITSRALIPADPPCGAGGIYVRADAAAPWIEEALGTALAPPPCEDPVIFEGTCSTGPAPGSALPVLLALAGFLATRRSPRSGSRGPRWSPRWPRSGRRPAPGS